MVQQAKCNLEMRFDIDITTLTSIAQRPGEEVQRVKDITWGKSHSIYGEIKSVLKNKNPGIEGGCQYLQISQEEREKELLEFYMCDWRLKGMKSQQRGRGEKSSRGKYFK